MDYFDRIEEYLKNTLSESDRQAFEDAMEQDENLKQAVADHGAAMTVVGSILEGEVRKVIEEEGGEKLKVNGEKLKIGSEELKLNREQLRVDDREEGSGKLKIENVDSSVFQDGAGKETKIRKMNWMRWAATAGVVFVLGWWGMNEVQKVEFSKRYAIVMETYPAESKPKHEGTRGSVQDKDLLKSALDAFNKNEWTKARESFVQLKETKEHENVSRRYLGHIYFIQKEYEKSIKFFNQIKESNYEVEDANQMLVNIYFILNKKSEMEGLLIKNPNINRPGNH